MQFLQCITAIISETLKPLLDHRYNIMRGKHDDRSEWIRKQEEEEEGLEEEEEGAKSNKNNN